MIEEFFKMLKELGVESLAELERLCKEERYEMEILTGKSCKKTSVNALVENYYRHFKYNI